ncbi:Bifunctional DNA primase/polymerase, N-terminal [Geodermatophilus ruber]|uniref:Bifunctional DNA primase/polymerase, N-terminal n=2 Tax=Geodermatophilus ruber TaxID=504800 RepID=A0A1I4CYX7_9ACTN|nr:Bifunctional DNA primase/polymerase, N-terminal [Geodermatophilus ruber]
MRLVARAYARSGIPVLPLWHILPDGSCGCGDPTHAPGGKNAAQAGKHPINKNGVKGASTDPRQIDSWWYRRPRAGIALATGHGFDVIDIDSADALQAVADLLAADRIPTPLAWARSGRAGGLHCLIPSVPGAVNGQRLLPQVDYRGKSGYVVAAPTLHRSLAAYAWLSATPALPRGDAVRGRAIAATLPWETPPRIGHTVGPRERNYAAARLEGQAGNVRAAKSEKRIQALFKAGIAMGARVHQRHISREQVESALLSAYAAAGGRDAGAADVLSRALEASAFTEIRPLANTPRPDVAATLSLIRKWATTPNGRKALRGMRRPALEYVLASATDSGSLKFRMAHRELVKAIGCVASTAGRVLNDLCTAGVLERVFRGSRLGQEAAIYRLRVPRDFSHRGTPSDAQRSVPLGDVPRDEKNGHPVDVPSLPTFTAMVHSLWTGTGRGKGYGLTYVDQRLLAALPVDGSPIKTAQWALAADCSSATVHRAVTPSRQSLASLGLVERCGWGLVRATPGGLPLVRAICGSDTAAALDKFAEGLGVADRVEQRVERVEADQAKYARGLLQQKVFRVLRGREGHRRDAQAIRSLMGEDGVSALVGLLADVDAASGSQRARKAIASLVEALINLAHPDDLRSQDLEAAGVPRYTLTPGLLSWPTQRVWHVAAVAASVRLITRPPNIPVHASTGQWLSDHQAEEAFVAGQSALQVQVPITDSEHARAHVDAVLRIAPLPDIREVMSVPMMRPKAQSQRAVVSTEYGPVAELSRR